MTEQLLGNGAFRGGHTEAIYRESQAGERRTSGSLLRWQSKMSEKKWQIVSWASRRQLARIWAWEQRNWGIKIIESRSVELKAWSWTEDFTCVIAQRYLECVTQWHYYSYCDEIRCQESDNGDCNRLRTRVGVTVNGKVWKSAIALYYL
jgi:hypothetical protein